MSDTRTAAIERYLYGELNNEEPQETQPVDHIDLLTGKEGSPGLPGAPGIPGVVDYSIVAAYIIAYG